MARGRGATRACLPADVGGRGAAEGRRARPDPGAAGAAPTPIAFLFAFAGRNPQGAEDADAPGVRSPIAFLIAFAGRNLWLAAGATAPGSPRGPGVRPIVFDFRAGSRASGPIPAPVRGVGEGKLNAIGLTPLRKSYRRPPAFTANHPHFRPRRTGPRGRRSGP